MIKEIPTFEKMIELAPQEVREYLDRCKDTPQSPDWHPEGDVYVHTKIVYERARKHEDIEMAIAALFHDLGKADVTRPSKSRPGSYAAYGHEAISARLVEKHKKWIGSMGAHWFHVYNIVKEHMRFKRLDEMRPHKQKELRNNVVFEKIEKFGECDNMMTLTKDEF